MVGDTYGGSNANGGCNGCFDVDCDGVCNSCCDGGCNECCVWVFGKVGIVGGIIKISSKPVQTLSSFS